MTFINNSDTFRIDARIFNAEKQLWLGKPLACNLEARDIETCEGESIAKPRKVINVFPGFYFLTVNNNTWSIVHDRDRKQWLAYAGNTLDSDPKSKPTKRELVASLLA